jgi:hypothetical protein
MPNGTKGRRKFQVENVPSFCWKVSKSSAFQCRDSSNIPCGICGEERITTPRFLRVYQIASITVIPPCPLRNQLSPRIYSRRFIEPVIVIQTCSLLIHKSQTLYSTMFLIQPTNVITPCTILTQISPKLYSRRPLIKHISFIPPCPIITHKKTNAI